MKIAVVDDDEQIRSFIVDVLAYSVNREVRSFSDGSDAWEYLDAPDSADIIVSDVEMPGMDGLTLLEAIKGKYPDKICVIMSGEPSNEPGAKRLGADAFLLKPFDVATLFDLVQKYVVGIPWKPFEPARVK